MFYCVCRISNTVKFTGDVVMMSSGYNGDVMMMSSGCNDDVIIM